MKTTYDIPRQWHDHAMLVYCIFVIPVFGGVYVSCNALKYSGSNALVSVMDALYFSLSTITHAGFGDVAPASGIGWVLALFGWIIGAIVIGSVKRICKKLMP